MQGPGREAGRKGEERKPAGLDQAPFINPTVVHLHYSTRDW